MNARLGLAIVVALQTVVLFGMVGMKQWTLSTGTPVLLETRPVDPRSLFRGDYVRLSYAINALNPNLPGFPEKTTAGQTIYVVLRKDAIYWEPVSIHLTPLEPSDGEVVIKGETRYGSRGRHPLRVRYGIEEYFIPEGEGRAIERPPRDSKVSVLVAVDKSGNAGIKAILIDGEIRYEETLF